MSSFSLLHTQLQALANPVRLWIVSRLHEDGPQYVSELARAAQISRPLMKLHLKKLEDAELVISETGTAENGKSANFYRVANFDFHLSPASIQETKPEPIRSPTKPRKQRND